MPINTGLTPKISTKDLISNVTFKNRSSVSADKRNQLNSDETVFKTPDGNLWRAMKGISQENIKNKASKLIKKFALKGQLSLKDINNLKTALNADNNQANNIAMVLTLADEKIVNPRTLKFVCSNGVMSEGMQKDIKMIFEARQKGVNPNDLYVPKVNSFDEGLIKTDIGDCFELDGQDYIFIKNKDEKPEQLKMDKKMFIKLFPPAERFANSQKSSGDCYFVSTVNAMMDNPHARSYFLNCFEQDGNDIKIHFPSDDFEYKAVNARMPKACKDNFIKGSIGMQLIEYAYGCFLENQIARKVRERQISAVEDMKKQLKLTTNKNDEKALKNHIKNFQITLDKFNEDQRKDLHEWLVAINDEREPETDNYNGILLRSLNQMNMYRHTNYQTAGDYYRGDGGWMEDVMHDFGYKNTYVYAIDEPEAQELLKNPDAAKNYIITGGTKSEGKSVPLRAEKIIDKNYSMYGSHAYRIIPSKDKDGNIIYKASNPFNSSHDVILTFEQIKEFFSQIHAAEII